LRSREERRRRRRRRRRERKRKGGKCLHCHRPSFLRSSGGASPSRFENTPPPTASVVVVSVVTTPALRPLNPFLSGLPSYKLSRGGVLRVF